MWIDQLPHCAPMVHPYTMEQIVKRESGGDPLAIHVNRLPENLQPRPQSTSEAVSAAYAWIAKGYSVDMGLVQLNSKNLSKLSLKVEQVLGTSTEVICTNLAAGGAILASGYGMAVKRFGGGQLALQVALSLYNTGTMENGFLNGYVAKYYSIPSMDVVNSPKIVKATSRRRRFLDSEEW